MKLILNKAIGLTVLILLVFSITLPVFAKSGFVKGKELYNDRFYGQEGKGYLGDIITDPIKGEPYTILKYHPKIKNKKFLEIFEDEPKYKGEKLFDNLSQYIVPFDKKYAYFSTWTAPDFEETGELPADLILPSDSTDIYNSVWRLNLKNGKYDAIYREQINFANDVIKLVGRDGDSLIFIKHDFITFDGQHEVNTCDHGWQLDEFYAMNVKDKKLKLVPYELPKEFKDKEAKLTEACIKNLEDMGENNPADANTNMIELKMN